MFDRHCLLFQLKTRDGHVYKLYLDGRVEGFTEELLIINKALPLFDLLTSLVREEDLPTTLVTSNEAKART